MKRILKKNQIIITTLAIMIAVAGYLNFSGNRWTLGVEDLASATAGTHRGRQMWLPEMRRSVTRQLRMTRRFLTCQKKIWPLPGRFSRMRWRRMRIRRMCPGKQC